MHVLDGDLARLDVGSDEVVPELPKVALIGGNGFSGQSALEEQIVEKTLNQRGRPVTGPRRPGGY